MKPRKPSSRWVLWAFAMALLLKAAMPLLASASAELQGKTLVEVCTVYGVSLVPLDGQPPEPASGEPAAHGGEHCALNAFAALATHAPPPTIAGVLRASQRPLPVTRADKHAPDACATWAARLQHAPPPFA